MNNNFWDEVFALVAEFDAQRPILFKQNRLYYNNDGSVIGYYETNHPDGDNYIILDDPNLFFKNNTHLMRVKNNKLILMEVKLPNKVRLARATSGFKTVKGHSAIVLEQNETYSEVDYYDYQND
jgi:hypothetical protein